MINSSRGVSMFMLLLVALVPASTDAGAWGQTYAIEISGDGIDPALITRDSRILSGLSFWVGPGSGAIGADGKYVASDKHPTAHTRSIVDWQRGVADDRPTGLQRLEVRFHNGSPGQSHPFIIAYELDPQNQAGYIYYPAWTNQIVSHGASGTWRNATDRWNELVGGLIWDHTIDGVQGDFPCVIRARKHKDGNVVIDAAAYIEEWEVPSQEFHKSQLGEFIGNLGPAQTVERSCWP